MEVGFHATHHVARQPLQVETLTELGGDDQLPQPWIGARLPFKKFRRDLDTSGYRGEAAHLGMERSTLPRNIFAVGTPMPRNAIAGISDPDRTVLKVGRPRPYPLLSPSRPRASRIFHYRPKGKRHGVRRAPPSRDRRFPGPKPKRRIVVVILPGHDSPVPRAPPGRRPPYSLQHSSGTARSGFSPLRPRLASYLRRYRAPC